MLRCVVAAAVAVFTTAVAVAAEPPPALFLLKTYDGSQEVAGWVMSEKLDGVRGVWDGARLRTRNGGVIHAPPWFIQDFPPFPLDGELWTQRGDFENITSIVRTHTPDERWRQLGYWVFEAPHQRGGLLQRLAVLEDYLAAHPVAHLKVIPQQRVEGKEQLTRFVTEVTAAGGEGVVVRDPAPPYQTGRLASALKVKQYQDSECVVRHILPGRGKYTGQMGALRCEWHRGRLVDIGSGFSDALRAAPPLPGTTITFKYYGLTKRGKPRFPVYMRVRR